MIGSQERSLEAKSANQFDQLFQISNLKSQISDSSLDFFVLNLWRLALALFYLNPASFFHETVFATQGIRVDSSPAQIVRESYHSNASGLLFHCFVDDPPRL